MKGIDLEEEMLVLKKSLKEKALNTQKLLDLLKTPVVIGAFEKKHY